MKEVFIDLKQSVVVECERCNGEMIIKKLDDSEIAKKVAETDFHQPTTPTRILNRIIKRTPEKQISKFTVTLISVGYVYYECPKCGYFVFKKGGY